MSLLDKYRLAFDISPVPMLLAQEDGEIVLANSAMCELFEYRGDELIGRTVETLVPDSVRAHHPELREAYAKVPTKRNMGAGRDLYGVTRLGQEIPLELGLEPVVDGENIWALVVAIDIRQRKQHEERMHLAMDAAASAMVMVNGVGQIVFVNRAALELFGYEETDLINRPVELLVPEEYKRAHPVYLGSFMSDSRSRSMGLGRDLFARHRDGRRIPVEIALTPVTTSGGKLVMSTIIDLTERVEARETLERKNEELAILNVELSQFAYSASHDLKAPLSTISGLLDICIEDIEQGDMADVLENLRTARQVSGRNAKKIEAVLNIARAGRERVPAEPVHFKTMIEEIWTDLLGADDSVELRTSLKHSDPITTERATLGVIMENLLSNALRYKDARKQASYVEIRTFDRENRFCVSVADNGIGISDKNKEFVFQMFKRIDERSGDGLGLSLVKKQIDRLGGSITFSSTVGEGAEFSFVLPRGATDDREDPGGRRR